MNKNILRQAQQMQQKLANLQDELEQETVEASAGGGVVIAVVSGKQNLQSIKIDPVVIDPNDIDMLQDLVLSAVNEAINKSQKLAADRMGAITGNMNIPGLM
jgi:hypothetical protein